MPFHKMNNEKTVVNEVVLTIMFTRADCFRLVIPNHKFATSVKPVMGCVPRSDVTAMKV